MRVNEDYFGHTPLNQFNVKKIKTKDPTVESHFNLKRIDLNDRVFLTLKVDHPTELKTFVEIFCRLPHYRRGYAFYEFLCNEDIPDVKEIIFMNVCKLLSLTCKVFKPGHLCIVICRRMENIFIRMLIQKHFVRKN